MEPGAGGYSAAEPATAAGPDGPPSPRPAVRRRITTNATSASEQRDAEEREADDRDPDEEAGEALERGDRLRERGVDLGREVPALLGDGDRGDRRHPGGRERRERGAARKLVTLRGQLLDLASDVLEAHLDREHVVDASGAVHDRHERVLRRAQVLDARVEVDDLGGDLLRLRRLAHDPVGEAAQRVDRLLEALDRHAIDDAGPALLALVVDVRPGDVPTELGDVRRAPPAARREVGDLELEEAGPDDEGVIGDRTLVAAAVSTTR